MTVYTCNKPAP